MGVLAKNIRGEDSRHALSPETLKCLRNKLSGTIHWLPQEACIEVEECLYKAKMDKLHLPQATICSAVHFEFV